MTVVVDLNVLLDVFQVRQPHYLASAQILSLVCNGRLRGIFPAHGITTLYYLVAKHGTRSEAESAVDQILANLEIGNLDKQGWATARGLPMKDFEDAVVASIAAANNADFIVTRNEDDFEYAPVMAVSPAHFLSTFPTVV